MSRYVAALPMYDWPQCRSETDAFWSGLRDALTAAGIDAPERLARRNGDLPPVPGGIRDEAGRVVAPDPAILPPDDLDLQTLWHHPRLLFAQTCWGPMELGLDEHVRVLGQPGYSAYEGGAGELYSSAILMRRPQRAPAVGGTFLPLDLLRGKRLAFNSADSMSGMLALSRDLAALGESLEIFRRKVETGSHRDSAFAVFERRADVCAVDCRTWALIKRFEPWVSELAVVGWTVRRKGLPYICSRRLPEEIFQLVRRLVAERGRLRPSVPSVVPGRTPGHPFDDQHGR